MELSRDELKEMMSIFKVESEEHLKNLNKGLLKLEEDPSSKDMLEELFRTAHSVKGAARMMGFSKIENVSHKIEDIFGLLRRGQMEFTGSDFDVVYEGVDVISQIIERISSEGTDDSIDIAEIIRKLEMLVTEKGGEISGSRETESPPEVRPEMVVPAVLRSETEAVSEVVPAKDGEKAVSEDAVIRVSTRRLDDLMNQVSELITTRIKSQQRLQDIKKVVEFCEEWTQQVDRLRPFREKIGQRIHQMENAQNGNSGVDRLLQQGVGLHDFRTFVTLYDGVSERSHRMLDAVIDLYDKHSEDNVRTSAITTDIQDNLRVIRLLPISTLFDLYPRMVRDLAKSQNKKIRFEVFGGDTRVDKKVLEELKDPLIHLLRNSIDHGVEPPIDRVEAGKNPEALIQVRAGYVGNMIQIEISDDGRGIDTERIAQLAVKRGYLREEQLGDVAKSELISLIFQSGFSTAKIITDISGRGVGLDVVKANVEAIKGTIETTSEKGVGTKFTIKIPLTLATTHALIVDVNGDLYSIPIDYVDRTVRLTEEDIHQSGSDHFIMVDEKSVPLHKLDDALGRPRQKLKDRGIQVGPSQKSVSHHLTQIESNKFPGVVFSSGGKKVAFLVDRLIDEQEVVVKNLGKQLRRVKNVAGSTVLGDGRISIILNPSDLIKSVQGGGTRFAFRERRAKQLRKRRVLVVDDSITTRTLEKNILESAGYEVTIATNGREGYDKLQEGGFEIIVSDVEMPYMTGFEFAEKVRKESKFPEIPFILCTSLESEKDKRRGIEVGANAYIVKGSFDQSNLLETIEKLI